MGGLGAYMIGCKSANSFAAVVPMCGDGSPVFSKLLARTACWFFHSRDDVCVPCSSTESVVAALRHEQDQQAREQRQQQEEGQQEALNEPATSAAHKEQAAVASCRLTLYDRSPAPNSFADCAWMDGHDCWSEAYETEELWMWLLQQRSVQWEEAQRRWI